MQHINTKKAKIIIKTLASIIRSEREKQNKSLRLLADEYEFQKSLLSRLENGKNEPKIISLWTISEALGLKTSDLIQKVEKQLPPTFSLLD